jgi:LysM repeat protein
MRSRSWVGLVLFTILIAAGITLVVLSLREPAPPAPVENTPAAEVTTTEVAPPTPTSLPAPTATPGPLLYTVQAGDTMSGIAAAFGVTLEELITANGLTDPNLIRPGDVLIIPGQTAPSSGELPPDTTPMPTAPPRPPVPTPTSVGPPMVEIAGVLGAGNLASEVVQVRNRGGSVSMEGWTLSDPGGNTFTFPRLVIFPTGEIAVYSGLGETTPTQLYWGRGQAAWSSGELIVLRDEEGDTVDTYIVP